MKFYPINIVFTVLILIPNLFFMFRQPSDTTHEGTKPKWWKVIIILENIGRIGIFVLPILWSISLKGLIDFIAISIMVISLLIYYMCWVRYYKHPTTKMLFKKILFIPLPLAIAPIVYYFSLSIILKSWILGVATLVFAIGTYIRKL